MSLRGWLCNASGLTAGHFCGPVWRTVSRASHSLGSFPPSAVAVVCGFASGTERGGEQWDILLSHNPRPPPFCNWRSNRVAGGDGKEMRGEKQTKQTNKAAVLRSVRVRRVHTGKQPLYFFGKCLGDHFSQSCSAGMQQSVLVRKVCSERQPLD